MSRKALLTHALGTGTGPRAVGGGALSCGTVPHGGFGWTYSVL